MHDAHRVAEQIARSSYGRLVGHLARTTGDIALAEDVLGDAFLAAIRTWPQDGVPDHPVAWLLTAARRRLIGEARRADSRVRAQAGLQVLSAADATAMAGPQLADDRLRLIFVCTHPAIDAAIHAPLVLQTVFGIDVQRMASVFNIGSAALGQRLVRAKQKIAVARIAFVVPEPDQYPARVGGVLDAIYAAYTAGWDDPAGADLKRRGLTDEAIRLARLLVELLPDEPEARGLLALMLHAEARVDARRGVDGAFIPLDEQDVNRWSRALIADAERHLHQASVHGHIGPYQLEAAIQSVHARRALTGFTDWTSIAVLYDGLVALTPTLGALVARAAAHGEAYGPTAGIALLDQLADGIGAYQPYWTVAAHLHMRAGHHRQASQALRRAVELTMDPAVRLHLLASGAETYGFGWNDAEDAVESA